MTGEAIEILARSAGLFERARAWLGKLVGHVARWIATDGPLRKAKSEAIVEEVAPGFVSRQ